MFQNLTSYRHLKVGGFCLCNGFRMEVTRLERIPGGVAADLRGIPGVEYPHGIYRFGFSTAADNCQPEVGGA